MKLFSVLLGPCGQLRCSLASPEFSPNPSRSFRYPILSGEIDIAVVLAHPCKNFEQCIDQIRSPVFTAEVGGSAERWIPLILVETLLSDRRDLLKRNILDVFLQCIEDTSGLPKADADVVSLLRERVLPRIIALVVRCVHYQTKQTRLLHRIMKELEKNEDSMDYPLVLRMMACFAHVKLQGSRRVICDKCLTAHHGAPCAFGDGLMKCHACGGTTHTTLYCDSRSDHQICVAWCARKPEPNIKQKRSGAQMVQTRACDENTFDKVRAEALEDRAQLDWRSKLKSVLNKDMSVQEALNSVKFDMLTLPETRQTIEESWKEVYAIIMAHNEPTTLVYPDIPYLSDANFLDKLLPPGGPEPSGKENISLTMPETCKTENDDKAYTGTGAGLLDIFNGLLVTDATIEKAWNEDPTLTVRLAFYLRSIHEGKGEKWKAFRIMAWLYTHHPRTLIANLEYLVAPLCPVKGFGEEGTEVERLMSHGYYKDLLSILYKISGFTHEEKCDTRFHDAMNQQKALVKVSKAKKRSFRENADFEVQDYSAEILDRLRSDPKYQALHIGVARIFADHLLKARAEDRNENPKLVSLVAKWAPSLKSGFEKRTYIGTTIAMLLTAEDAVEETGLDRAEVLEWRRNLYAVVVGELRKRGKLVESLLGRQEVQKIDYQRVPAVCHKKNQLTFLFKDSERYLRYLDDLVSGKKRVQGKNLSPAAILRGVYSSANGSINMQLGHKWNAFVDPKQVWEKVRGVESSRWLDLEEHVRRQGGLEDTLCLADVSGSMGGLSSDASSPFWNCLALSLLTCRSAKGPWANHVLTFETTPRLFEIPATATIFEALTLLASAPWGGSTDIYKAFLDIVLPLALKNEKKAPKRLVVFSDMQFDQAQRSSQDESSFERVKRAFRDAGVTLPELVFWNLRASVESVPVTGAESGVTLLQGYSPSLLKLFLDETAEAAVDEEETIDAELREEMEKQGVVIEEETEPETPLSMMIKALNRSSFSPIGAVSD